MDNEKMHIHKFKDINVPSTCKENGYTLHKCDCGYEHKDNFKPLGQHKFEIISEAKPTCTESGNRTLKCKFCGEEKTESVPHTGHDWDKWTVQTFATCVDNGEQVRVCKLCGAVETQVIKATGHNLTSKKKSKTEKGMVEYFCKNCGETVCVPSGSAKAKKFLSKHKKKLIISFTSVILLVCLLFATFNFVIPSFHYIFAKQNIKNGNYTDAYYHLLDCNGIFNSEELLEDFKVVYLNYTDQRILNGEVFYSSTDKYEYDENGNIKHEVAYDENGNIDYTHEYDENGNETRYINYNENGEVYSSSTYEYEYYENGNRKLYISYDGYGNISNYLTYEFEYYANGNIKHEIIYDENGNKTREYEHYKNGNMKRSVSYHIDGAVTEYKYDKKGKTKTYKYSDDGIVWRKTKYIHTKNGYLGITIGGILSYGIQIHKNTKEVTEYKGINFGISDMNIYTSSYEQIYSEPVVFYNPK